MEIRIFEAFNGEAPDARAFAGRLQRAIDECAASGGGRVVLDRPGVHVCDGIELKDGVELVLEDGVTLKASGDETTYRHRPGPFELNANNTPICAFIYAKDRRNVAITGAGAIDGNYERFILPDQGDEPHLKFYAYPRPMTVYLEHCEGSRLHGVTLCNAPFWTVHLVGCVDTAIREVTIRNEMRMPNTDGIDVDRCRNTVIERCIILTGDDGICPKCTEETARYGDCCNLWVRDCHIESQSSAIKFGSSSFGNFENCSFEGITIRNSNRALAFQLRDRGSARNIAFRDVTITTRTFSKEWWGSAEALYLTLLPRDEHTDLNGCVIENVTFERISGDCGYGLFACAEDPRAIRNVVLRDVSLRAANPFGSAAEFDVRPWKGGDRKVVCDGDDLMLNGASVTCENVRIEAA
ncbi:polygalacturonase [Bifidobacterium avesanii]|uniref:Polygalacturonase n=2 Tax=Bifidobacterium avesanii TaxID=1798157 RepID=A0A7K3TIX7_9BIFI|nr:polygalacturonase [Bifidobacterium avesanii]